MTFRFVHTADLHLDSPLRSLALRNGVLAETVGVATRAALGGIVDLCLAQRVDALLIAGDLYDGAQVSMKTAGFLAQELRRLDRAGIATFIIRGNHDAASRITRELQLPASVTVFGTRAHTHHLTVRGTRVALHGMSFAKPQAPDSLLPHYPAPVPGAINIGLMHTSLNGSAAHDVYAPCATADLDAAGYDYWALGHIHKRAVYRGRATVVMPGIPQGRDIGEAGPKSVTLAEIAPDGRVTLAEHGVASVQFDRVEVGLTGCGDWGEVIEAVTGAMRAARRGGTAAHLVVRLVLSGATPLRWRVQRDLDLLRAEAALTGEEVGSLWLDKIEATALGGGDALGLRDGPPDGPPGGPPGGTPDGTPDGLPDDLARLVLEDLPQDPGVLAEADRAIAALIQALPPDLRNMLGADAASVAAARDALLRDGAAAVLAALAAPSPDGGAG